MSRDIETTSAITNVDSVRDRISRWVLLTGNRLVIAAGIVLAVMLAVATLVELELLAVGPDSAVATLFGSGITSGVVTLMTIALSINQLILSRVFGSPKGLHDRLEGTTELRRRVERFTGRSATPNDPAAFLSVLGSGIANHAAALQSTLDDSSTTPPTEVTDSIGDIETYGERIDDRLEGGRALHDVLSTILGTGYAVNLTAVRHLRQAYADELPREALSDLESLESLLESVAVTRQFFKTIALQEDLARLSRLVVYTGLLAFVTSVSVTLVYQSNTTTVPASSLPTLVTVGVGAASAPLAVFSSFILRSATIGHETLSVGPFVPPQER